MTSVLNKPYFYDEVEAFKALEEIIWPNGPTCPHCGATDRINRLEGVRTKASKKNPEGEVRHGLWKCYHCRGQFTVRKGTVFEASHLKLHQWFQAAFLMCSSKKGVSSNQLHRTLGCTLKTAWFVAHRLREAMRAGALAPFWIGGGAVEADETFIGRKRFRKVQKGYEHKMKVLTLIDRTSKQARSVVLRRVNADNIAPILRACLSEEARLMTDEAAHYKKVGKEFLAHSVVSHEQEEYVRGDAYTNTCENFFSVFKRGMTGVYHHCKERHLHRYMAEFDFRYNNRTALGVNDTERTTAALLGAVGKRLTYRDS
ncbi:MAG: IS1595 family transposase [Rhodospirillaceae bacterium]